MKASVQIYHLRFEAISQLPTPHFLAKSIISPQKIPRWWFQIFFYLHNYLGEMIQFEKHIWQMGGENHQLGS